MSFRKPAFRPRLAEERVYDRVSNDNGYKRHYNDDSRRINGRSHHDPDRSSGHFRQYSAGRTDQTRYSTNPSNLISNNTSSSSNSSNNELDDNLLISTNSGSSSINQRLQSCVQRSNNSNNVINQSQQLTTNPTLSSVVIPASNCNLNNSNNNNSNNSNNNNINSMLISPTSPASSSSFHQTGSVAVRSNDKSSTNNQLGSSATSSLTMLTNKKSNNHTSTNSLSQLTSLSSSSKKSKKKKKKRKKSSSHGHSSHYNREHRSNNRCSTSMSCSDVEDSRDGREYKHSSRHHSSTSFNNHHNHHSSSHNSSGSNSHNLNNNLNNISGNSGNLSTIHHHSSSSHSHNLNSSGSHHTHHQYNIHSSHHHNNNTHSPLDEDAPLSPSSSSSNLSTASSSRVSSRRCSISPPIHSTTRKQSSSGGSIRSQSAYKSTGSTNDLQTSNQTSNNNQTLTSNLNSSNSNNNNVPSAIQRSHSQQYLSDHGSNGLTTDCILNSDKLNDLEHSSNNINSQGKPLAICVRNLPVRSTDSSLKDGLFHEYKKHGRVTMVKVIGQGPERFAVVCFKKYEDVEKALEVSKDKQFFGCKIEVSPHEGLDCEDNDFRPLEAELDEYHPKATRTLFVGNLEKDITNDQLKQHFKVFGEIIEMDIKKQGTSTYAFIQYSDICSVVKAMRKLDGENLGSSTNRIKLGFGKSMPTNCVWIHGIAEQTNEKTITRQCSRMGPIVSLFVDRQRCNCLVTFDSIEIAQLALTDLKGRSLNNRRMQVDFASRECEKIFHQKLEASSNNNQNSGTSSSSNIHPRLSSTSSTSSSINSNSSSLTNNNNNNNTNTNTVNTGLSGLNSSTVSTIANNSNNNDKPTLTNSNNGSSSLSTSGRLSSRVGSITSSPRDTNLPPLPQTQWSNTNSSSSYHLSNRESSRRLSEQFSSTREDKLTRGHSFSPHNNRSLDCDIKINNDRHLDDKGLLYNKNDDYSSSKEKERLNRHKIYHYRTGEEQQTNLPNHKQPINSSIRRHSQCLSPPSSKSPISHQSSHNSISSSVDLNEILLRYQQSALNKPKLSLPMDLPLPEFSYNCKFVSSSTNPKLTTPLPAVATQDPTIHQLTSNKELLNKGDSSRITNKLIETNLPSPFNNQTSCSITTAANLLMPLSVKCDDKLIQSKDTANVASKDSTKDSIMSPLHNLTSPINSRPNQQQRLKSESISSDNSFDTNATSNRKDPDCLVVSPERSPNKINKLTSNNNKQPSMSFDDRIRALDEKFNAWSSSPSTPNLKPNDSSIPSTPDLLTTPITSSLTNTTVAPVTTTTSQSTPVIDYSKYNIKKKSQVNSASTSNPNSRTNEPSDIVKSLLSKSSIFDQDSKRLENINEKYEPKDAKDVKELNTVQHKETVRDNNKASSINPSSTNTLNNSNHNKAQPQHSSLFRTKAAAKEFQPNASALHSNNSGATTVATVSTNNNSSISNLQNKKDDRSSTTSISTVSKDSNSSKQLTNVSSSSSLTTNNTNSSTSTQQHNTSNNSSNTIQSQATTSTVHTQFANKDDKSSKKHSLTSASKDLLKPEQKKSSTTDSSLSKSIDSRNKSVSSSNVNLQQQSLKKKDKEHSKEKDHKEQKDHSKEKDHKEQKDHNSKLEKKAEKKTSISSTSSSDQQQSSKHEFKKQLSEEKAKLNKESSKESSKDHGSKDHKDKLIKKKEKLMKEKHEKSENKEMKIDKIEKLKSSSSSKDKEHHSKDKDHSSKDKDKDRLSKKSSKKLSKDSMDLDNTTSSKQSKEHKSKDRDKEKSKDKLKEKDQSEKKKSKKSSSSKEDCIDLDGFIIDKETAEQNRKVLAAMKKLGCSDATFCFSMYDKVKARSSQKGNTNTGTSGSANRKSESDYGGKANKSGHDTDSDSDSSSSSSSEDGDIVIRNKKQSIPKQRHFNKHHQSDSSDDELPFSKNQSTSSKSKLNQNKLLNRKRKLPSSDSSSSSSSDSSSDSDKEPEIKPKKKQLKKSSAFSLNSDSDDENIVTSSSKQTPVKHKNASPSHSTTSAFKKNKFANIFDKDKKSSESKEEQGSSNNKKRSLQDDKSTESTKHSNKDDKIKKKKLQKSSTTSDLLDKESDSHKAIKEEKKLSTSKSITSEQNDDSDDMSAMQLKKKKKKSKDKLKEQTSAGKLKDKESNKNVGLQSPKLMSPKSSSNSSFMKTFNKQQLKEDLELSDSDTDMVSISNKNKQSKKDERSSKKTMKSKDEKHEKKTVNKIEENKSKTSLYSSDSDSEIEQPSLKTSSKKPKKSKDKDRPVKSSVKESKTKIKLESSDSSDGESIVSEKKTTTSAKKKDKLTNEKPKKEKSKAKDSSSKKSSLSKHNERQSSISDLSMKQHYSEKESDSDSDSECDNLMLNPTTTIKNKSPKSTSERIFNSILANQNKDMYSSSDSEQSDLDNSMSKMDTSTHMFLSPNRIQNNIPDTESWITMIENPSSKSDEWNDITKSDEAFDNYLKGSSQVKGPGWVDSDEEESIRNSMLPSLGDLNTSTVSNALTNQASKDPLTSSTGKEVLKAIKSPKKAADLLPSSYPSDSQQQVKQHKKNKDSKQLKEDKCKENNEDRKKKSKKSSKEHHHKDSDHHLSLFDTKEIKSEPIIAASAQIHHHHQAPLFGNTMDKLSSHYPILQPASPFSEKQLMNTTTKPQRLLTDVNNSTANKGLFGSSNDNKTKSSPIKDDLGSKSKLSKASEMMFSISSESSNDESFLPTIGVSFSSSSSNSSNSNQNVTILPNLINNNNNKDKQSQDKQPVQRKYEEEAAIEAKRLEAELMKTKDLTTSNWKSSFNKDPPKDLFLDLMTNVTSCNERLSTSSNTSSNNKSSSNLNLSTNKQMHNLHKKPASKPVVENATTIFNVITSGEVKDPFLDSDETQFKISDVKDELDDQRKIEDDLAVSALLELEMNNESEMSHLDSHLDSSSSNNNNNNNKQAKQKRKLSSEMPTSKELLVVPDEEPNRLHIAEDINENSVDSDVFHSAGDEILDAEAIAAVSAITATTGNDPISTTPNKSTKTSPIQKLKSPPPFLLSPINSSSGLLHGLPTIIEAKPVPNIVDVSTHQHQFNHSDYGAEENELTIDLNEEDTKKSISPFMSTLEKLTTNSQNNKQRKNSSSSISNLFDLHTSKDSGQLEIEIPTSLADVKQSVSAKSESEQITLLSPKQQGFTQLLHQNEKDSIRSDASDLSTDALQSPNSISLSQNKTEFNEESSVDNKSNQQGEQRPRKGRRPKTVKSSDGEDGLKITNTPLSPTSSNISPNSTTTANNKTQTTRRLTRGLISSSDVQPPQNDSEFSNENLSEDNQQFSLAHKEDDQSINADSKGKRGRKKKVGSEQQQQTIKKTTSANKTEASKNLSPYDVFEFNDSDEENSPTLPLMTLHEHHHKTTAAQPSSSNLLQDLQKTDHGTKETNKDNITGSSSTFFEQITPVTPMTQPAFSLTTNTSPTQQIATGQPQTQSEQDKEYTTELSQHGKLSITIRLQQKDKEQSSSSPEHSETDKLNEDNQNSSNSTDLPSSNNNNNSKPMTRKSARLMLQGNKTTIDEVIDDVVKGIFNEDSHDYSLSATENLEYQDLEEEIDSNPSDNELEKSDEYSFDNNEENTSTSSTSKQPQTPAKETTSANSSLNRPFSRVTRSSAKNNDQQTTPEPQTTETVELKLPNTIVSTSVTSSNTTSLVDQNSAISTQSQTVPTTSTTVTSSSSNAKTKQQHTVMKVEIPKFTKTSNNADQQPIAAASKSIDDIKKEDNNASSIVDPLVSKLSSSSIATTKPSPTPSPQVITTSSTSAIISDQKPNLSTLIQPNIIPNVSERMHNSQTPLKLKTGKFNLEDYSQISLSSSQNNTPFVSTVESSSAAITTNTPTTVSSIASTPIHTLPPQQAHSKSFIVEQQQQQQPIKTQQQPCIPTSVVVTSSIAVSLNQSISPSSLANTITTSAVNQPLLANMNNNNIAIRSASSPFKDATDLQSLAAQQQMRLKGAKTPQLQQQQSIPQTTANNVQQQQQQQQLLSSLSSPFPSAGQMGPSADFNNLLHQQMLLQQMHNNPYLAAAALQHPDLRGLQTARIPGYPFGTLQSQPTMGNEKDLLLEDSKLKIKSKIDSIVDSTMHPGMHPPPPPLAPIRTSGISSMPNTPLSAANYPMIRTPIPPHLLSPHDQTSAANNNNPSMVQQQRFTESPYGRAPLMSPNLKVDIKPQLIGAPQRPQSTTFSMPGPINSPSPIMAGNTPSAAQLSPSLGYRKDLQSPMPVLSQSTIDFTSNPNESTSTAMLPRKLHHRYAKEQQLLSTSAPNLMQSPYQIPVVGVHPNLNLLPANYQLAAVTMQQLPPQATPIQIQQMPQPQDQSNSGGDSVLIQKYPKLWQGLLELKNDQAAVQMHFVTGNSLIAHNALPPMLADGTNPIPLKIAQRMRLEQTQLDGVCRKMQQIDEHCILLALPCGRDHMDVINQSNKLRTGFIQYLQSKQAAGIINSNAPGTNTPAYVVHIFPSCEFSNQNLERIAPDLLESIAEIAHLLVVIATV